MIKYKHRQPQYKKAKRLLNLLKYRRHKKIRESIFNSRKKLASLRAGYNRLKHKYFLKKEKLGFYDIEPLWSSLVQNRWSPQLFDGLQSESLDLLKLTSKEESQEAVKSITALLVAKKKYKIHSYLFNVICKFPGKYVYHFFGKDILRKYYTMPFRFNISRFISNKVLKGYYRNLSHKALLNLCQKASKGRQFGLSHALSFKRGGPLSVKTEWNKNNITDRYNYIIQKRTESAERAKNFVLCLEERLDSTLLRLLHFKPLNSFSSVKRSLSLVGGWKQKLEANEIKITKYPKYQIKSPWSYFSAEHIKQLINHGHIQVNGKKVKSPNIQIRIGDQIKIKGFIANLVERSATLEQPKQKPNLILQTIKRNHLVTLLLRRFKDQTYLDWAAALSEGQLKGFSLETNENNNAQATFILDAGLEVSQLDKSQTAEELLYNYIKDLKIKRFIEAFYMTYRNFHLIERTSSLVSLGGDFKRDSGEIFEVEKHIQPVFETIGYNQSIYLLWPVISLLRTSSWGPTIKRNLIQSSTRALRPSTRVNFSGATPDLIQIKQEQHNIKRKLQNLLKWKKLQTSGGEPAEQGSIPNRIRSLILQNPSWLGGAYTQIRGEAALGSGLHNSGGESVKSIHSKFFRSYASIVYGTRKCKWIKLQQGNCGAKSLFYNQIPNHTQFFQLELEYFQAVYRGVHG